MKNDKQILWDLFTSTGEPKYYTMYVRARDEEKDEAGKTEE